MCTPADCHSNHTIVLQSPQPGPQVTPTGVFCRILCLGPYALDVEFKGLIR